ncbi:penicillin-binding transpeptidase domain-containing protein [Bacillus sp. 1P06AnD]|uniref:penicillin-binding protein PBP4(5) n=1 Tax=Bacillus sp. 1P06AnD TaxID=3132208 RepID=UPI0039A04E68
MKKAFVILVLFLVLLLGYQFWKWAKLPKSDPEVVFSQYLKHYKQLEYEDMYTLLSKEELKRNDFTKKDFLQKYKNIYSGIGLGKIDIHSKKMTYNKEKKKYEAVFSASLTTSIGVIPADFHTSLVKEDSDMGAQWKVEWSPGLILPDMEYGDKAYAETWEPVRGEILDRNGIPMAKNGEVYEMGIVPGRLGENKEEQLGRISKQFSVPIESLTEALGQKWVKPDLFVPIKVMPRTFNPGYFSNTEYPGVSFQIKKLRVYPLGEGAAHLIGYVKKVTAEDLEKDEEHIYSESDYIGKAGLEYTFEKELRGKKGGIIGIKDSSGDVKRVIMERKPVNGTNVELTINSSLQNSIYQQLKNDTGAVSAMNPSTGELLALVSYPSYDPNLMVAGMSTKQWKAYSDNPNHPFINRFSSVYAPGSTFKAITAAVGVTLGTTYPEKKRAIHGLHWKKDASWGGYYVTRVKDASPENMNDALAYSDNIYFAQEALEMGAKRFEEEAVKFGFKEDFQLPIALQKSQLSNKGITTDILLADSAYGQGQVLMSPIHLGVAFTPFANNGALIMPRLLKNQQTTPPVPVISPSTANTIREGLIGVVERPDGTAHSLKLPGVTLAAKTGTAELKKEKGVDGLENGFLVAFNTDQPKILLTALVEDVSLRRGSHYVNDRLKPVLASYLSFSDE